MIALGLTMLMQVAPVALQMGPKMSAVPFAVGEVLEYRGKWNFISAGAATLSVLPNDTIRGVNSWKFSLVSGIKVNAIFKFDNSTTLTSWTGLDDFVSRRFTKRLEENGRIRNENFLIFPDSGYFRRNADAPKPTSKAPLDDVAFIYYLRTLPLELKRTYKYDRYFRSEKNPVTVEVLKREEMEMPDGSKVKCLVLHPVVDEPNGMFSKSSNARLWLTDDARRIPVRIESTYTFGTVSLILQKVTLPHGAG
ncbi:MAG: DUF3108 domain-containing protein [Gemmatimonadales bacterium]